MVIRGGGGCDIIKYKDQRDSNKYNVGVGVGGCKGGNRGGMGEVETFMI